MQKKPTVKARQHHGAKSLDITIPVAICSEYKIQEGDVFTIDIYRENDMIKILYSRIYEQSNR